MFRFLLGGKKRMVLAALLGILSVLAWWGKKPILEWYYLRELTRAQEESRDAWAQKVADLGERVLPRLLEILQRPDARACAGAEAALVGLLQRWGAEDPRALNLMEEAQKQFPSLSREGQQAALQVPIVLLGLCQGPQPRAPLTLAAGNILATSVKLPQLHGRALVLALALVDQAHPGQWLDLCRNLALLGLKDADPENRSRAVHLVLKISRAEPPLLSLVVPLLGDEKSEVRRAALVALGPSRAAVSDDDLLPLLHDPDQEVRRLCEESLRSRGLQDKHILLARLVSDPHPSGRLQVVHHLVQTEDLEPGIWLRRLSHDPVPAVRAAAVRAAYFQPQVDLRGRLRQMAQEDPSPTVRQLAEHYLSRAPIQIEN